MVGSIHAGELAGIVEGPPCIIPRNTGANTGYPLLDTRVMIEFVQEKILGRNREFQGSVAGHMVFLVEHASLPQLTTLLQSAFFPHSALGHPIRASSTPDPMPLQRSVVGVSVGPASGPGTSYQMLLALPGSFRPLK